MAISRIDLINRAIPKAFRGYDCDKVDRFMEEIAGTEKSKAHIEMKLRNTIEDHLRLLNMEKEAGKRMEEALHKSLPGLNGPEIGV
jgi:DivIVA domain-containing protein